MKSIAKLREEARRHEQREAWDRAIQAYQEILFLTERAGEADLGLYNRLGDLHLRVGRLDRAVELYEEAADRYAEQGLYNNAIALCNKALRNAPGQLDLCIKLGRLCASQGFLTDARRWFLEYAEGMFRAGALEDAFVALEEFAELSEDADIREMLARQLQTHDRIPEALIQLKRAYRLRARAGDAPRAEALRDEILALDPEAELPEIAAPPADPGGATVSGLPGLEPAPAPAEPPAAAGMEKALETPATGEPGEATAGDEPPEVPFLDDLLEAAISGGAASSEGPAPDAAPEALPFESASAVAGLGDTGPGAEDGEEVPPLPLLETGTGFEDVPPDPDPLEIVGTGAELGAGDLSSPEEAPPPVETIELETPAEAAGLGEAPPGEAEEPVPAADGIGLVGPLPDGVALPSAEAQPEPGEEVAPAAGALEEGASEGAETFAAGTEPDAAETPAEAPTEPDERGAEPEPAAEAPEAGAGEAAGGTAAEAEASDVETAAPEEAGVAGPDGVETADAEGESGGHAAGAPEAPEEAAPAAVRAEPDAAAVEGEAPEEDAGAVVERSRELAARGEVEAAVSLLAPLHGRLAEAGRLGEALEVVEELIALEPDSIRHHQQRVEYAFRVDDQEELIAAYLEMAAFLARKGSVTKAEAVYQRILDLQPDHPQALAALAAGRAQPAPPGEVGALVPASAGQDAARFVVSEPVSSGDEDRDFAEMLSQFRAKVSVHVGADDPDSHYDLGLAFKEMGLVDEAIAEFQTVLRAGREGLRVYEELGHCFRLKGEYEVAVKVLTRALQLSHSDPHETLGIHYHLGRAHEELGGIAEARAAYQRVVEMDEGFEDAAARLARL